MKKTLMIAFIAVFTSNFCIAQTYNIKDFGAQTDSLVVNTRFIQSAIDECYKNGGGEVIVPAGKFYTGTIFLKSNVYLHLSPGSVLQGSYNDSDYPDYNCFGPG